METGGKINEKVLPFIYFDFLYYILSFVPSYINLQQQQKLKKKKKNVGEMKRWRILLSEWVGGEWMDGWLNVKMVVLQYYFNTLCERINMHTFTYYNTFHADNCNYICYPLYLDFFYFSSPISSHTTTPPPTTTHHLLLQQPLIQIHLEFSSGLLEWGRITLLGGTQILS